MSIAQAALELASQGVAVFPCGPDKKPRIPGGFHNASTDPDAVKAWKWWDDSMIGAAIPQGQVVVDVDPRNGGTDTLALLEGQGHEWPPTRVVTTRSQGTHHYYAVPEDMPLRASLGPGIDVKRAGKGYVIVPPSEGYALLSPLPVAPAPDWLLEELVVPDAPRGSDLAADAKFFQAFEDGTSYGLRAMEGELGRLATAAEGGRNNALNAAAFALAQLAAGGELDEGRARDELANVALLIGLDAPEARATIESGWSAGLAEPRQAPPKVEGGTLGSDLPNPTIVGDEAESRFWVDWNIEEDPPPFYAWPMLPQGACVLVYGATEASKSMVWMALLCEGSHRGLRSSFYSFENPAATDRERLRRWAPDPANFRLTKQPLDFNDPRQLEALVKREKEWGTNVVLLDTYSMSFSSRSDDGNGKAIDFYRRVRYVMHEVGCSVVVIDHTGFEGDEPRDASAKRQQCDVAILMRKQGTWVMGEPSRFSMENRKAARFANPFFANGSIRDVVRPGEPKRFELAWTGESPRWDI